MTEQISLRYANTMQDIIAFNEFHYRRSPALRRIMGLLQWLGAITIFLAILMETGGIMGVIGAAIVAGGFAAIYPLLLRRLIRWQVRLMYSEGRNKGTLGEHEMEICEDGVIERSPYRETKTAWAAIERIEITPEYTFLYASSMSAYVIPHKSILAGDYRMFMAQLGQRFQPDRLLESKAA